MKILVLADTHVPRAANDLPAKIYDEIANVDMIIHVGDFVEKELLEKLQALKETKAVYGNMDSASIQHALNPKEVIQVGKFRIGLTHGHGGARDIVETVRREFDDVDAIVFGHSHVPINIVKDGILFFNPGSPTDTIFSAVNSYGILEVSEKGIEGKIIKI